VSNQCPQPGCSSLPEPAPGYGAADARCYVACSTLVWRNARSAAVISTRLWDGSDVADAGILCVYCCVVDTLSELWIRRMPVKYLLFDAIFVFIYHSKSLLRPHVHGKEPAARQGSGDEG
jgi:hypothetical protein